MFWLQGKTWCSAAMSCGGLWFRQTNVLWTAFLMVLEGVRALEVVQGPEEIEGPELLVEVVKEVATPVQITTAASLAGKKKRKKGRSFSATIVTIPVMESKKEDVQEEVQEGPWTIDVKNSKMNNGELGKAWEKVLDMARKIRIWNPVFTEEVTAQGEIYLLSLPGFGVDLDRKTKDLTRANPHHRFPILDPHFTRSRSSPTSYFLPPVHSTLYSRPLFLLRLHCLERLLYCPRRQVCASANTPYTPALLLFLIYSCQLLAATCVPRIRETLLGG